MTATAEAKDALVDTLRRVDPESATLCEGWNVRFLLAHLVQREQETRRLALDTLRRAAPGQEPHLRRLAETATTPEGYVELVDRFVAGPPRWSPWRWAGPVANLLEYTIHHEDVRRGAGPAPARTLSPRVASALARQVRAVARLRLRRSPVGVRLRIGSAAPLDLGQGAPRVTLTAAPVELALFLSGRRHAADVELTGPADDLRAFVDHLG